MKLPLVVACLLLMDVAFAQQIPKVEAFGGFSVRTFGCPTAVRCVGANPGALKGWDTQVTGYFNRWVGLSADIGGYYDSLTAETAIGGASKYHLSQYSFLFGPTVGVHVRHQRPFAHALFGVDHLSTSGVASQTDNAWAMALGGGSDVDLTRMFGLRLGFDWMRTNNFSQPHNEFRFVTGVVLKLPRSEKR